MSDDILRFADALMLPRLVYTSATDDTGAWQEAGVLTVTSAAQKFDLNTTAVFANALKNPIAGTKATFITVQPRGGSVYIRAMHTSDTTAAGVTSATSSAGVNIADGEKGHFWVTAPFTTIDVISATASVPMLVWKSNERPF